MSMAGGVLQPPGSRPPQSWIATHGNVLPHLACLLRQARGCSRPIRGTPGPTRGLIQVHVFNFYQTIIHIGTQQSSVCFLSHMRSNPRGTM